MRTTLCKSLYNVQYVGTLCDGCPNVALIDRKSSNTFVTTTLISGTTGGGGGAGGSSSIEPTHYYCLLFKQGLNLVTTFKLNSFGGLQKSIERCHGCIDKFY